MIEVLGLTKRYGTTTAVDDLSFAVPDGKVTGFLGPNGAGKSTTLRMMVGLDEPSAGAVRNALLVAARVSRWDRLDPAERARFDAAGFSLNGIFLANSPSSCSGCA